MIIELPNCAVKLFSQPMEKVHLIMIPRPGKDRTQPSPYRPISLLSCISLKNDSSFFAVRCNANTSENMRRGVPQGSVFGLTLYHN